MLDSYRLHAIQFLTSNILLVQSWLVIKTKVVIETIVLIIKQLNTNKNVSMMIPLLDQFHRVKLKFQIRTEATCYVWCQYSVLLFFGKHGLS